MTDNSDKKTTRTLTVSRPAGKAGKAGSRKGKPAGDAADVPRQRSGERARRAALQRRAAGAGETAAQPDVGKFSGKPAGKFTGKPAGKLEGNYAGKPAGASTDKPMGRPAEKRADKWTDKPADKPVHNPAARKPAPAGLAPQQHPRSRADNRAATARPRFDASARDHTTSRPAAQRLPAQAASQTASEPAPDGVYRLFAPCPQGLEAALVAELHALGYANAKAGRAGAQFSADWAGVMRANLTSRLATRILVQVAHGPVAREDDILALATATPWERWFGPEHRLRVDTSAVQSPMQSLHYCNLRAKDGICDRLRAREGARPDIDTVRPDARVHLFLSRDAGTLYLDSSGESLFKRGWRLAKGAAPLRENLAAGLLALSGWQPGAPLIDPFCGSGTILIEAAEMALAIPPGINRPFGFERWRGHDARGWQDIKDAARAAVKPTLAAPLIGTDTDPSAIAAARANAERAGLAPDAIDFQVADARRLMPPDALANAAGCAVGWIVTNPPYGERLDAAGEALWQDWASVLKHHYAGWQLAIISNDTALPQHLRLKPRLRTPVKNGALDCRLFQFELVAAGYRG